MSEIIHRSANGDRYYREDLEEDRSGNLYIYDEYDRKRIYFEEEYPSSPRRGASNRSSRGRDRGHGRDREESRHDSHAYDVSPRNLREALSESKKAIYDKKSDVDYDSLPDVVFGKKVNSIKGFFNTILEAADYDDGTHIVALYPNTTLKKYSTIIESFQKYIRELLLKPDLEFTGNMSDEEDAFLSNMVTESFEGIRMEGVSSNITSLMAYKGQSDAGWNVFISKLGKALEGKIETNLFVIPSSYKEAIASITTGTDEFSVPKELREKLNVPLGGYVKVGELVYSISYSKMRLFMVIP